MSAGGQDCCLSGGRGGGVTPGAAVQVTKEAGELRTLMTEAGDAGQEHCTSQHPSTQQHRVKIKKCKLSLDWNY